MGSHSVSTHWMYQYYGLCLAWWWLNEPKHVAEFLIFNIDYYVCCVIDEKIYYIIDSSLFLYTVSDLLHVVFTSKMWSDAKPGD